MKTLDKSLLETATQRLGAEFQPEQAWLYGSRAWGSPHDDSDVDLLVIVPHSDETPIRRSHRTIVPIQSPDFQSCNHDVILNAVKTIQPDLLNETVERLKAEFQPEEIYLFGSHAWGTPNEDSDVDLMFIVPSSDERPVRRGQRAQKCLGRLAVPDVLVRTRGEVNRYKHLRASLFHQVLNQGRKLYG